MANCAACEANGLIVDHHLVAVQKTLGKQDPADLAAANIHALLAVADAVADTRTSFIPAASA
jgi:hypothetical protein